MFNNGYIFQMENQQRNTGLAQHYKPTFDLTAYTDYSKPEQWNIYSF